MSKKFFFLLLFEILIIHQFQLRFSLNRAGNVSIVSTNTIELPHVEIFEE
jgi:hypothetical protein